MTRTNIAQQEPGLYKAAIALGQQADAAALENGLAATLIELIKVRVSQVNGCAFCLRMHTADALAKGESAKRLAVLPAWRETGYFDDSEREALELAERVTRIGAREPGEIGDPNSSALTAAQIAAVAWVAIVINTFNRIAITSHYRVAPVA